MEPLAENRDVDRRWKNPNQRTKKILLIGDAKNAALFDRPETYRLVHCDTVRKAWDLVYRDHPHLIVLDLGKSQQPGAISALRECRALAGCVPIIVVAPSHLTRHLASALEHHAAAVIPASAVARSVDRILHNMI
jgi:DNA-binding NarL/FixJ family response regulator